MKISYWSAVTLLLASVLLTNCSQKTEEEKAAEAIEQASEKMGDAMKDAAKEMEEAVKDGKESVATVDFRTLKELLPTDADGLDRKKASGQKTGAMGFNVSTAEADYANADGSERIGVDIVDAGGTGALMGMAAWSLVEVDKEDENGYEKTSTIDGNKCFEKYNNTSKNGEINLLVKNRFIVTVKGDGVSMDKLKATLEDIDLDKLGDLK